MSSELSILLSTQCLAPSRIWLIPPKRISQSELFSIPPLITETDDGSFDPHLPPFASRTTTHTESATPTEEK